MAKDSDTAKGDGAKGHESNGEAGESAGWTFDAMSDTLRDAVKRAGDLAQNPYARGLLAAGMAAAAAALVANKNAREATRRNVKGATEAAEAAAHQASEVGVAIVNAATEAVQHMLSLAGIGGAAGKGGKQEPPADDFN